MLVEETNQGSPKLDPNRMQLLLTLTWKKLLPCLMEMYVSLLLPNLPAWLLGQ